MPPEPRIIGRYAIYGEIASGGMASVHLGRLLGPVGFSKTVAVKRLHEQFAKDEEFVSMFIDEARLAARIHHSNVVQTLDVVQHDNQLLLVMEYVHGVQLSTLTRLAHKSGKRMPPPVVIAIVAGMLRGLHAAHDATDEQGQPLNLVHRDVSPHNVLVGVDGVPRVIDFGVAKAAGRLQQTATGQLKGKVPYMAPEQVRGQTVTRRTDVFASGVVLWETLLGRRLFSAENDAAVISQILDREIEPPSRIDLAVPPPFDAVVMRALEREPSKRFESAREMAEALESCDRVAAPAEVAEYVQAVAAEQLAKRTSLVSGVESTSAIRTASPEIAQQVLRTSHAPEAASVNTHAGSSSASVLTDTPKRPVGLMLGLVALLGMAGIGFLIARELVFRTPSEPPAKTIVAAPPASSSPPAASASAPPPPTPSVSASEAPSAAKPKPKPKPATTTSPPPSDCDPPYTFDSNGMKKYKPHCL